MCGLETSLGRNHHFWCPPPLPINPFISSVRDRQLSLGWECYRRPPFIGDPQHFIRDPTFSSETLNFSWGEGGGEYFHQGLVINIFIDIFQELTKEKNILITARFAILKFNTFLFSFKGCFRSLIIQTIRILLVQVITLELSRFTPSCYKDIRNRKFEASNQFFCKVVIFSEATLNQLTFNL